MPYDCREAMKPHTTEEIISTFYPSPSTGRLIYFTHGFKAAIYSNAALIVEPTNTFPNHIIQPLPVDIYTGSPSGQIHSPKGGGSKTSNNTAEMNKPLTREKKSRRTSTIDNAEMSRKRNRWSKEDEE